MKQGHGSKAHQREAAIAALLASPSIAQAAASCGLSNSTLDRWLQDAEFLSEYRAARRRQVEHAVAVMQRAATAAVTTVLQLLKCDDPGVQLRAATLLIEKSMAGVTLLDHEDRLTKLENGSVPLNGAVPHEVP